jgi:hypothetical protein
MEFLRFAVWGVNQYRPVGRSVVGRCPTLVIAPLWGFWGFYSLFSTKEVSFVNRWMVAWSP